jgi:hypothetical protein
VSTRLDLVLRKFPEHGDEIRALASRDPSGNLKYLDWGARVIASRQALAPEVADVIDLFHRFRGMEFGRRHRRELVRRDIYSYRPQDLAHLRDAMLKIKRATEKKRRERERLYRIEGSMDVDVVYDSPDLIVRHIKNKNASVHYGLSTKWCISMQRDGYFESYETNNATFFFFERKSPVGDEFDKVAVMLPRGSDRNVADAFTAIDRRIDMMALAGVYGPRVFDIFRAVYECSERYPGSTACCVRAGTATREQLESMFASITGGSLKKLDPYEMDLLLVSICCNDAAPPSMLEEIARSASALSMAAWKRWSGKRLRRMAHQDSAKELVRAVMAALVIHPLTPDALRANLVSGLRRRHVDIEKIRRVTDDRWSGVGVVYRERKSYRYRRTRRVPRTAASLRAWADRLDRRAVRARKQAKALERKLAAAMAKKKKRASAR